MVGKQVLFQIYTAVVKIHQTRRYVKTQLPIMPSTGQIFH